MIKVGLVFSISNFFIAKTSLANNWRSFSSSYSALDKGNLKAKTLCVLGVDLAMQGKTLVMQPRK